MVAKKARHLSSIYRVRVLFAKALTRQRLEGACIRFTLRCREARMHHFGSTFISVLLLFLRHPRKSKKRTKKEKKMQFKTHRCTIDSWNIKFSLRSSHVAAKLARQLWSSEFAAQLFLSVTVTAKPCPVSVHKNCRE